MAYSSVNFFGIARCDVSGQRLCFRICEPPGASQLDVAKKELAAEIEPRRTKTDRNQPAPNTKTRRPNETKPSGADGAREGHLREEVGRGKQGVPLRVRQEAGRVTARGTQSSEKTQSGRAREASRKASSCLKQTKKTTAVVARMLMFVAAARFGPGNVGVRLDSNHGQVVVGS